MLDEDKSELGTDLTYLSDPTPDIEEDNPNDSFVLESRIIKRLLMKKWIDHRIPFLGGKSPREVLNENKKISLLLDLMKEYENLDDRQGNFNPNYTYSTLLGINIAEFEKR